MNFFEQNKIKAVIFDLDGTLLDSMELWKRVLPDFLEERNLVAPEDMIKRVAFMTLTQSSAYVAEYFKELNMTGEEIREAWMQSVNFAYANTLALKKGAKALIESLRKSNIKIAIATSCDKKLAKSCLVNNGIYEYIDEITFAEDVGCGKDNPKVYLECLKKLDCDAEHCVIVEDILVAVKTAKAIGAKVIAVEEETAFADKENIMKLADKYIKDFDEV